MEHSGSWLCGCGVAWDSGWCYGPQLVYDGSRGKGVFHLWVCPNSYGSQADQSIFHHLLWSSFVCLVLQCSESCSIIASNFKWCLLYSFLVLSHCCLCEPCILWSEFTLTWEFGNIVVMLSFLFPCTTVRLRFFSKISGPMYKWSRLVEVKALNIFDGFL